MAVLISSCGGSGKNEVKEVATVTIAAADPKLAPFATDSIDVLFFKKPFTDSSRYTRYFIMAMAKDSSFEAALSSTLKGPSSIMDKPRTCLSEGKIIIPKGGDAYKTLYFSRSGEKQCRYIYEIKEGLFLYYQIPDDVVAVLNELEKHAVKVD
jgi:hypothetical protein